MRHKTGLRQPETRDAERAEAENWVQINGPGLEACRQSKGATAKGAETSTKGLNCGQSNMYEAWL